MSTDKFVYVTYIATTPQRVWEALLKGALTRQYWKHKNISRWKPGSKWALVADDHRRTVKHVGRVLKCVPNERLVMTWAEPSDTAKKPSVHKWPFISRLSARRCA
ncbi:MAG: SRPBCC domain-containing protein [Acidiferrobacteraceae bacterium]